MVDLLGAPSRAAPASSFTVSEWPTSRNMAGGADDAAPTTSWPQNKLHRTPNLGRELTSTLVRSPNNNRRSRKSSGCEYGLSPGPCQGLATFWKNHAGCVRNAQLAAVALPPNEVLTSPAELLNRLATSGCRRSCASLCRSSSVAVSATASRALGSGRGRGRMWLPGAPRCRCIAGPDILVGDGAPCLVLSCCRPRNEQLSVAMLYFSIPNA